MPRSNPRPEVTCGAPILIVDSRCMGRDILDFTGPAPVDRLGLDGVVGADGQQRRGETGVLPSGSGSRLRGLLYVLVTAIGLVAAGAIGYFFWLTSGRPDLLVDDRVIANPEEILGMAEEQLRVTVEADGGSVTEGASCFFSEGGRGPNVVCGPVLLGVSPDDEPWLLADTSYQVEGDTVVGAVEGIRGTTAVEPRDLVRPDGQRPVGVGSIERSMSGSRRSDGSRLLEPQAVVEGAEAAFFDELVTSEDAASLNVSSEVACFLQEGPGLVHGVSVVGETVWCGPARSADSGPDDVWLRVSVRYQQGPTFGTAVFEAASPNFRVQDLPEGAVLIRPDGRLPADEQDVDRPPVAVDHAVVVDYLLLPASAELAPLVTDRYRIDFTGFDRVDNIGEGARSFSAPDGHDLVVASIGPSERSASPRGLLLVDGAERPLPSWSAGDEGGALVVVVPEGAISVEMMVENDGRPQMISLLDGTLGDGFPLALYRPLAEIGESLSLRVDMPVGEAVLVTGGLAAAEWSARDADGNWLPEGESDLALDFDQWDVDRPCCEVDIQEVVATFTLIGGPAAPSSLDDDESETDQPVDDGQTSGATVSSTATFDDQREDLTASPSSRAPTFRVPEELMTATLRIDVEVRIVVDEAERTITEEFELALELP